jgi:membrane associated rhomboid family serine protease
MINELRYKIVNSDIMRIFTITISLFTFISVVKLYYQLNGEGDTWFYSYIMPYFAIGPNTTHPITKPWTILSHFFIETGLMAMISNFIWLWFFGFLLQDLKGKNSVLPIFVISGLVTGLIIYILATIFPNAMQQFHLSMRLPLVTVVVATVLYAPQFRIFTMIGNGIPLYVAGIIFLLLNAFTLSTQQPAILIGYVVAIVIGVLYNYGFKNSFNQLQNKLNNDDWKPNWTTQRNKPNRQRVESTKGFKVVDISEHKMNEILDKINAKGMDSLTPQEKEWLHQYSNK